jgi:hypothetical protein
MPQTLAAIAKPLNIRELKDFAAISGPALTAYLPSDVPGGMNRRLSARLRKLAEQEELAAPLRERAEEIEAEGLQGPALAIFSSRETFRHYWLPRRFEEQAIYKGGNFHIRPVLDLLEGEQKFYILNVAQKDVRLLRCTEHSSEEVDFNVPRSLVDFLGMDQPDHNMRNNSQSGADSGHSNSGPSTAGGTQRNVAFTTSTDKEDKDEYLLHYFAALDKAAQECLRNEPGAPLVPAGVEYELALFRRVSAYPNLCAEGVQGAANGLKGGEMHARALQALEVSRESRVNDILAQHEKQAGGLADASVSEIVKAAYDGRIAHLIIGRTAQAFGNFDEATHRVREHRQPITGDEDLLNAAAVQAILHAGDVFVVPDEKVPNGRPAAAVMRY